MHDRICLAGRSFGQRHFASDLPCSAPEAAGAPEDHTAAFVAAQDGVGTRPGTHRAPRRGAFFPSVKGLADEACGLHSHAEQPVAPDLSNETFSGHREPSAWEQRLACAGILAALAFAITGGRPVAWLVLRLCEVLG